MVPEEVVLALRDAVSRSSVDDLRSIWSSNAEEGLFSGLFLSWRSYFSWQLCLSWKRSATDS